MDDERDLHDDDDGFYGGFDPNSPIFCPHTVTTFPDDQGFVICLRCTALIRRPEPLDDMLNRIKG